MVPTLTKVWARFLPIYFPHPDENKPSFESREFDPGLFTSASIGIVVVVVVDVRFSSNGIFASGI